MLAGTSRIDSRVVPAAPRFIPSLSPAAHAQKARAVAVGRDNGCHSFQGDRCSASRMNHMEPGEPDASEPMKVAIVYPFFPHYRAAVLRELLTRGEHDYLLVAD